MAEQTAPTFRIHKIYVKDSSFESPRAPDLFVKDRGWQPKVGLQLNAESRALEGGQLYECCLTLTLTVELPRAEGEEPQTAYLAEIKQAGLFQIEGVPEQQLGHMLGAYCPGVIFPFARAQLCEMAVAGGFPQLLLEPINFDALYQQQQQQAAAAATAQDGEAGAESADDAPTLQ